MWKITIIANILFMILFLLASELAIMPAYNSFIQYSETGGSAALPLLTKIVLSARGFALAIPVLWVFVSILLYKLIKQKTVADRNEYLLVFTSTTLFVGFSILILFGLAGILPYLLIGAGMK